MSALDLAGELSLGLAVRGRLPAGPYRVRQAAGGDREALLEMFARCSTWTRYRRFHGHVAMFPSGYLDEALGGGPDHLALVAAADQGTVVALASCRTVAAGVAELGFLVEDAWQRRGIGAAMLREIAGCAGRGGLTTLTAQVLAEQGWIVRALRAYGTCESAAAHGVVDVTVRLG